MSKKYEIKYSLTKTQIEYHENCKKCQDCFKPFSKDNNKVISHKEILENISNNIEDIEQEKMNEIDGKINERKIKCSY